ncbi:FAD binding domain-containing protein [Sporormia fimetaria CBS 119925]|uniref:FAD binding domain-containing protein n=1 Tax=Sporormia fimetaria CBS 119925 TaxID=1340428 RepID=A0A6A6VJI8_9PLEO|nr:FAD binding domain-containing protein [Sporormia fimetaria CBS 119925]
MRFLPIVSLGATVVGTAIAQSSFEPANFNITEALLDLGIDESILIDLETALDGNVGNLGKRTDPCSVACSTLRLVFGSSKLYTDDVLSYWSLISDDQTPKCTFKPTSALEVSKVVLISRLAQCPFAVKGGGHTGFAGASNIDGGITVSLERLKAVDIKPNNIVEVGPGNRWVDVYTKLQSSNLAVVGGRASSVGVPGFLLGGGVSHHINARGFACDNIAAFEVVTSSGVIVKATPTLFADLYWALRGGGGNFGIVTKFYLETFQQGPVWGGTRRVSATEIPAVQQAFVNMARNAAQDTKATQLFGVSSVQVGAGQRMNVATFNLMYLEPVSNSSPPAILQEYLDIPFTGDDFQQQSLVDNVVLLNENSPDGSRQYFWALPAIKLDLDMIRWMSDLFLSPGNTPSIDGVTPLVSLTFQAFTVPALQRMQRNGGNPLGIKASDGPLFHCMIFYRWSGGPAEDARVNQATKAFEDKVVAEAKKRGLLTSYTYMNYAGPYAKVIEGYGATNNQRLKSIARVYDPTGVFQRLVPGGHKLEGSPL